MLLRVPAYEALPRPGQQRLWGALADRPFVSFAALDGAMGLQYQAVSLLLPIWISAHTHAPRWTVAGRLRGQLRGVRAAAEPDRRRGGDPEQGGRAFRYSGLFFLAGCPLMALSADVPVWVAPGLLVLAVTVHSVGEVGSSRRASRSGSGWHRTTPRASTRGCSGSASTPGRRAPAVLTTVCLGLGQAGWLLLGGFFATVGSAGPPLARWAERTRPAIRGATPAQCAASVPPSAEGQLSSEAQSAADRTGGG